LVVQRNVERKWVMARRLKINTRVWTAFMIINALAYAVEGRHSLRVAFVGTIFGPVTWVVGIVGFLGLIFYELQEVKSLSPQSPDD